MAVLQKHNDSPFHAYQSFLQKTVYAVDMLERLNWTSITCVLLFRCLTTIFFVILSGVRLSLLVLRPLTGLLHQPRIIGDGDCGEKLVE
jgi:hypothetical protein